METSTACFDSGFCCIDGSTVLQFAVRFYSLNPEYLKEEAARCYLLIHTCVYSSVPGLTCLFDRYYFFAQVRQDIKYSRSE